MNKKGDTFVFEETIFIVLNLLFVVVFSVFVFNSSYGAIIYEQTYAKQIALLIDGAKPGTTIGINMDQAIEIAKKYHFAESNEASDSILAKVFVLEKEKNSIKVSLSGREGYEYRYFSSKDISFEDRGAYLYITVQEVPK